MLWYGDTRGMLLSYNCSTVIYDVLSNGVKQ